MTTGTMSSDYDEDESPPPVPVQASRSGVLDVKTHCEYPALAKGADHHGFVVMVHLKAPALVTAAPLDLVAVLDVSESMAGAKLAHVKRAMAFVIDRLGPRDRLSVVAFSGDARQVIGLTRMTDDGKAAAKLAVEALEASSTPAPTIVRAGLDEAAKVLDGSRRRNDVASVILVSGGRQGNPGDCSDDVLVLVPPFLRPAWCFGYDRKPVHTFLLGSDSESAHDAAAAMHNISEATGGTFSFIEDPAVIQDALAQCIGGLLSVTAKDVFLEITGAEDAYGMMNVTAVKSGRYKTSILSPCKQGGVDVGELYADEERRILLFLDIPRLDDDDDYSSTGLINVQCSYTDVASGQEVVSSDSDSYDEILRPVEVTDVARCVEVERELLRVAAAEGMALAREAAERGAYDEAARILDARRESLMSRSAPALSGDAMCAAVAAELHELSQRVSDEREFRKTGRACILASMSSHGLQRGSTSSVWFGCGLGSSVFATPAMRKMEKLSDMLRKKQEAPPWLPLPKNNGSKTGVPLGSRRLEARLASAVPRLSMLGKYRRLLLKR